MYVVKKLKEMKFLVGGSKQEVAGRAGGLILRVGGWCWWSTVIAHPHVH